MRPDILDVELASDIERLPDAVLVADDERRYIHANVAACTLFGLPLQELLGRRIDDFVESQHRSAVADQWAAFLNAGVQSGPFRLLRPDGSVRSVEFTAIAHLRPGAHISFLRDTTEQQRTEQALRESERLARLALSAGRMGSWIWDAASGSVKWSETLEQIYGLPAGSFNGTYEGFIARIHPEDREYVSQRVAEAGQSGNDYEIEFRTVRPDGSVRWISDRGQVLFDPQGQRVGMTGVCWDSTEAKEAERALRKDVLETRRREQERVKQTEELARSNAELQRFAYVASHDLKEPLRNISIFSQLLANRYREKLDHDAEYFIREIVAGATRMAQLIDDLLTYSRAGLQRDTVVSDADANDLLDQAIENLKSSIHQTGALLTRDPLPRIRCAPLDVVQLFQNLIGNAVKYCNAGPPRVHISCSETAEEWVFQVRDNGIGIDPEYHDQIFGVFKRLHGREYPGTGIGLAICKALVERHGGRMGVQSQLGSGSTFWFALPR